MDAQTLENLKYPIGRAATPKIITTEDIKIWMKTIEDLPEKITAAVRNRTPEQLDTPYRPGGWTVRQVVHHVADSHMNGYTRLKLALTEKNPTIKPYEEQFWAELPDSKLPVEISLNLITALHARWSEIYKHLAPCDFEKTFKHPAFDELFNVKSHLYMYHWHSLHHLSHIGLV